MSSSSPVRLGVLAVALGMALVAAPAGAQPTVSATILAYHRLDPGKSGPTTVLTSTFLAQLDWLERHHVAIAPLSRVVAQLKGQAPAPSGPEAVITFDDGHESVFTQLFPIIRSKRIPVTLFIYPSAISKASYALTWDELRQMQASGLVEVQSHTYWHPNFKVERKRRAPADYQAFVAQQLANSRSVLEARLGRPVTFLAWPYGIVDPELEAAAHRSGYVAAFGFAGGRAQAGGDLMAVPRIPIDESDKVQGFAARIAKSVAEVRP